MNISLNSPLEEAQEGGISKYLLGRIVIYLVVRILDCVVSSRIVRGPAAAMGVHKDEEVKRGGCIDFAPVILDEGDKLVGNLTR